MNVKHSTIEPEKGDSEKKNTGSIVQVVVYTFLFVCFFFFAQLIIVSIVVIIEIFVSEI
jgi:hypothetical protein